ncbi:hypothetical protein HWB99_gp050 [Mycobacterium phage DrLupo]|uniref:Uncharacterized protein n=1 Tax=Mycobacterium phage DrLupo TaxID=2499037 RepID=A0A3S9UQM2_9CAUD|nr:hypothetical protein HWB99_gp050 [Mycobacterium phage DrLupo]AZS12586.1 hypothetical protein SEA_DRLUPO_50 [Mycobacterium phage DrLupo]
MSARNFERIEDATDSEGYILPGYSRWDCEKCGNEVRRYRGERDASCNECGAQYNAGGQRLRDDWRDNPAWSDDSISDMDGYEMAALRRDAELDGMY